MGNAVIEDFYLSEFARKLKELQCLYAPVVDDKQRLFELMFVPGPQRINFLKWILTCIDEKVFEKFQICRRGKRTLSISDSQCILDIFVKFGFCSKSNSDLIQGTTPVKKQISFFMTVLETLGSYRKNCSFQQSFNYSFVNPLESFSMTFTKSYPKYYSEHLLDVIADNSTSVDVSSVIPADILRQIPKPKASLKMDLKVVDMISAEIEMQDNKLKQLPKLAYPSEIATTELQRAWARLLKTISSYTHLHSQEIQPFCVARHDGGPVLSSLGPTFSAFHECLQTITKINDFMASMKDLPSSIKNHKEKLEQILQEFSNRQTNDDSLSSLYAFARECDSFLKDK